MKHLDGMVGMGWREKKKRTLVNKEPYAHGDNDVRESTNFSISFSLYVPETLSQLL